MVNTYNKNNVPLSDIFLFNRVSVLVQDVFAVFLASQAGGDNIILVLSCDMTNFISFFLLFSTLQVERLEVVNKKWVRIKLMSGASVETSVIEHSEVVIPPNHNSN